MNGSAGADAGTRWREWHSRFGKLKRGISEESGSEAEDDWRDSGIRVKGTELEVRKTLEWSMLGRGRLKWWGRRAALCGSGLRSRDSVRGGVSAGGGMYDNEIGVRWMEVEGG